MVFGVVEAVDEEVCENTEKDSQTNSEESQAVLPSVEAIDRLEGIGVGGEKSEKHGKGERRVEAEEENCRLSSEHV